ncbi:Panacea domain-containing protein [Sphingomonas bisphenolicum]|nr:Panacea domain-containing protein [Sphingomonas bisphenolicum]
MQFDRDKMRAVILRACHSCNVEDLGAVKLNKVLYYFDMISYAHHRYSVTGAVYRKRPNGPTSDQLLFLLRDMARDGEMEIRTVDYFGYLKKEYHAKVAEPEHILNNAERALLDDVLDFVCNQNTAKSISEYSHKLPWEMAEMGGVIGYETAMLLFPSQPSPEAFDLAARGMTEVEATQSKRGPVAMSSIGDFRSRLLSATGQH